MRWDWKIKALLVCMGLIHFVCLFAGFFSPYDWAEQDRDFPFAPPSHLHFHDGQGKLHWRPSVCRLLEQAGTVDIFTEDRQKCFPVRFLVRGPTYRALGLITTNWHLFGVDPAARIFLAGSDSFGRDVFSRLVYGGQVSLLSGLLAAVLSVAVGFSLGVAAGYYGRWVDALMMRCGEMFLALPWLYLLLALRAFLPLRISAQQVFLFLIVVTGLVGWARPAKLIRGLVLSARERPYTLAARLFGASDRYIMRRHIAPHTYSILLTQAALLVPQYIVAEVTLSFLGLGVGEPVPSWGNMLATLQHYQVMVSYWWMWAPACGLVPVFLSYTLLASALQDQGGL
jgi:peptide/nickel transport system permease protein